MQVRKHEGQPGPCVDGEQQLGDGHSVRCTICVPDQPRNISLIWPPIPQDPWAEAAMLDGTVDCAPYHGDACTGRHSA